MMVKESETGIGLAARCCRMCGITFRPARRSGREQHFCCQACRHGFEQARRRLGDVVLAAGLARPADGLDTKYLSALSDHLAALPPAARPSMNASVRNGSLPEGRRPGTRAERAR